MAEESPDEILAGAEETLLKLGEAQVKSGLLNPDEILQSIRRRHQRLPGPQQARQRRQHRLPQAGRIHRRHARRRSVHPGGAPFHGKDRLRAEHRAARGAPQQTDGGGLLARNVEGVAADPHAVRGRPRGQPAIPHRLPVAGGTPQAEPVAAGSGGGAALHRRHRRTAPDGHARQAAAAEIRARQVGPGDRGLPPVDERPRAESRIATRKSAHSRAA